VSVPAIFNQLRLLKVVEDGLQGCTSMSSRLSVDNATWNAYTVLRMHRQAEPAPWAFHFVIIDDHDSDFSARDSESDFSALFGSS